MSKPAKLFIVLLFYCMILANKIPNYIDVLKGLLFKDGYVVSDVDRFDGICRIVMSCKQRKRNRYKSTKKDE